MTSCGVGAESQVSAVTLKKKSRCMSDTGDGHRGCRSCSDMLSSVPVLPTACLQGALSAAPADGAGVQERQTGTDGAHRNAGDDTFQCFWFFFFLLQAS